jgi:hypothetical protein
MTLQHLVLNLQLLLGAHSLGAKFELGRPAEYSFGLLGITHPRQLHQQLIAAQQAWISYRDQDCRAKHTLFATGTIRAAVFLGCLVERTEQRTRELRAWIQEENR